VGSWQQLENMERSSSFCCRPGAPTANGLAAYPRLSKGFRSKRGSCRQPPGHEAPIGFRGGQALFTPWLAEDGDANQSAPVRGPSSRARQPFAISIICKWPLLCTVSKRKAKGIWRQVTLDGQVLMIAFLALSLKFIVWGNCIRAVKDARVIETQSEFIDETDG
jgi:hypothetical protein